MKTAAIIQARMNSSRLPGKVLKTLCGRSVLSHVVERVSRAQGIDEIIVATTDHSVDDDIAAATRVLGATLFRGSETDVLARYYLAASAHDADVVVRVTSDCPLFEGGLLGEMLRSFAVAQKSVPGIDYLSNTLTRRFPRGLDAEIFTFAALEQAYRNAARDDEREHVTPFIYRHPDRFRLRNFGGDPDYSQYRWTLDTIEDWRFIEAVYGALFTPDGVFGMNEILSLLSRHPELPALNAGIEQKMLASS